ncbi:hypothetical protein F4781DRAFT_437313 [Annulohypoxylon bovei var. microspora]|nr:hypothetical protein F4781DRAFT_437313 [Annulohypoxylon bovei var. microspora]
MALDYPYFNMPEKQFRLLDLPAEAVLEICDAFLPGNPPYRTFRDCDEAIKGLPDLARLARTCKSLAYVVNIIFRKFKGHSPMLFDFIQSRPPTQEGYKFHERRSHLAYLLLNNPPNVTSISLYSNSFRFIQKLQRARPWPLRLRSLKQARFIGFPVNDLAFFERYINAAPNLEVLELKDMERCGRPLPLPNVRSVSLIGGPMEVKGMDNLLDSLQMQLESFTYITSLYDVYLGKKFITRGTEMLPNDLVKSLESSNVSTDLQTLKLDLRERGDFSRKVTLSNFDRYRFQRQNPLSDFIETLKCFPSLRHITLTQQCLWEPYYNWCSGFKKDTTLIRPSRLVSLLPDSVESFTLVDVTVELFPAIIGLAEAVHTKKLFPDLKQVLLHPHPDLIRQHAHAKAHADDPNLPDRTSEDTCCVVDSHIEPQREMILRLLKEAEVDAGFPLQVYPIHTESKEDLERQRRLGHWCQECHFYGSTLVAVKGCERGRMEAEKGCVAAPERKQELKKRRH